MSGPIGRFIVVGGVRVFPRQILVVPLILIALLIFANVFLRSMTTQVGQWSVQISALHNRENAQACVQPEVDPTALPPELIPAIPEPLDCLSSNDPDWLQTDDFGKIGFHPDVKKAAEETPGIGIECDILPVIRSGDDTVHFGNSLGRLTSSDLNGKVKIDEGSSVIVAKCKSSKSAGSSKEQTRPYLSIVPQQAIQDRQWKGAKKPFNLVILMLDSLSRAAWQRYMKSTIGYFTNELGATVLEGYNIVGDGTPQNMFPLLMGLSEFEMPESRRFQPNTRPLDELPWLFKTYRDNGYVTLAVEDMPVFSMYNYRFIGFDKPPADFYSRPFYLAHAKNQRVWESLGLFRDFCLGTRPKHALPLDWLEQMFRVYRNTPKLVSISIGELTHDDNAKANWADEDIKKLLTTFKRSGYLEDTFFMLLSDHGARYDNLRATLQGKLEERLPFVGMYVPSRFKTEFPTEARMFTEVNQKRLSTPYDIHSTFIELLELTTGKTNLEHSSVIPLSGRSQSLFHEVPLSRTCEHAKIESHWCACIAWVGVPKNDKTALKAAEHVVSYINTATVPTGGKCEKLSVGSLITSEKLAPNTDLLRFRKTNDRDGYRADMSDAMVSAQVIYQLTIETLPSHGKYFATVTFWPKEGHFTFDGEKALSRLDRYGSQPWCIVESHPQIRPYCYCKQQKS